MAGVFFNSFNGGAMGRKMRYRTDIANRNKAVAELVNANVLTQGGIQRRAGTELLWYYASEYEAKSAIEFPAAGVNGDSHVLLFFQSPYSQVVYQCKIVNTKDGSTYELSENINPPADYVVLNDVIILFYNDRSPLQISRWHGDSGIKFSVSEFEFMPPLEEFNTDDNITRRIWFPVNVQMNVYSGFIYRKIADSTPVSGELHYYKNSGIELNEVDVLCALAYFDDREKQLVEVDGEWVVDATNYPPDFAAGDVINVAGREVELSGNFYPLDTGVNGVCKYVYECVDKVIVDAATYANINLGILNQPEYDGYVYLMSDEYLLANQDISLGDYSEFSENTEGVQIYDFAESGPLKVANTFSVDDLAVRENDDARNYTEYFGLAETVQKTVNLGTVLGDWQFRTNGNWTGSYTIQTNNGTGWKTFKTIRSKTDYNININDGSEDSFGVQYQLIIDIVTDSGTQETEAQYTFEKSGDSDIMVIMNNKAVTPVKPVLTHKFSEPHDLRANTAVFHQQRLWLAYGAEIYASEVNNLKNFAVFGTFSNDKPIKYRLADTRSAAINWLHVAGQNLMVGTDTAQWMLTSESGVLTPSATRAVKHSNFPTCAEKPKDTGVEFVFVDASGKRLYISKYNYQFEVYTSQELSIYNDDILTAGIKRIVFDNQSRLFYILDNNGRVKMLNYDLTQGVIGFSEIEFNFSMPSGEVLDMVSFINADSEVETILVVKKDSVVTTMFKLNDLIAGDCYFKSSSVNEFLDFNYNSIGNEVYYKKAADQTWQKGVLTTDIVNELAPSTLEIMHPVEMKMKTFPLDFGAGTNSTYTKRKKIDKIHLMLTDAGNVAVSWDDVEFEELQLTEEGDGFAQITPHSGEFELDYKSGWDTSPELTIVENSPYKAVLNGLLLEYEARG